MCEYTQTDNLNMICFRCNNEEFDIREASVRQVFRGELFDVMTFVSVCKTCGWQTLGSGQTDELRIRVADAYREKHGLLTTADIQRRRGERGMSQVEFARFLDVGVASVKRWENGCVQEPIYDRRIREKCDSVHFPYEFSVGAILTGCATSYGQLSIKTKLLNTVRVYMGSQSIGSSNLNSVTTSDAQLSAVSKMWRKKHSKSFDTEFTTCH